MTEQTELTADQIAAREAAAAAERARIAAVEAARVLDAEKPSWKPSIVIGGFEIYAEWAQDNRHGVGPTLDASLDKDGHPMLFGLRVSDAFAWRGWVLVHSDATVS